MPSKKKKHTSSLRKSKAAPFDERMEDKTNAAFFREVAPTPPDSNQNLQEVSEESFKKYQEFEKWQKQQSPGQDQQLHKYQEFEKWQKQQQQGNGPQPDNSNKSSTSVEQDDNNVGAVHHFRAEGSGAANAVETAEGSDDDNVERPRDSQITQSDMSMRSSNKEESISEDIYSLIYTANMCSQPFVFAIFVFILQETLLLLILLDMIDLEWSQDNSNPLRIPPGVPIRVNVAQAISMVLIVVTILGDSGDLTNGIGSLAAGYDRHVLSKNPHASCFKWFLASGFQTLAGCSMTVVLFFLVMQSTTVISLALNFAALSFVYEIDNLTFGMGKQGFLTRKIKKACERVNEHVVPKKRADRQERLRKFMVVVMLIGLFIPYGLLVYNQWDNQFLCTKLYVQFNGEPVPDLVYFTGMFYIHKKEDEIFGRLRSRKDDRVFYEDKTKNLILAYCDDEEAWTISLNTTDHCAYLYKSSETQTFDVTSLAFHSWFAWDFHTRRAVPVGLYMRCEDCTTGARGNCHSHNGFCVDNECVCKDDRLGINCEHALPACDTLRVDARTNELPFEQEVWFTDNYHLLYIPGTDQLVQAQKRPVYVAYYYDTLHNIAGTDSAVVGTDFMFFNGRRWVIISMDPESLGEMNASRQRRRRTQSSDDDSEEVMEALLDLFGAADGYTQKVLDQMFPLDAILTGVLGQNYTDAILPSYRPFFYSEAVSPRTETDLLSPVGLAWHPANRADVLGQWRPDENRRLTSIFLCSECQNVTNPCLNSGVCNSDHACECNEFFEGSMCERTISCHKSEYCLNNGTCLDWKEYCSCPEDYFGSLCQYKFEKTLDYVVKV